MPRPRRAAAAGSHANTSTKRTPSGGIQSALNFSGRVTKPGSTLRSASGKKADEKAAAIERALSVDVSTPAESQAEEEEDAADDDSSDAPESSADFAPTKSSTTTSSSSNRTKTTLSPSSLAIRPQPESSSSATATGASLDPEDVAARKVTEAQIKKYWAGKEAERTSARVHQGGLSVHEKVLREFDMSVQYGPCMGVARSRRWKLANELGLNPPIEVLGVLVKDEEKASGEEKTRVQRAYVDELMGARFVVD